MKNFIFKYDKVFCFVFDSLYYIFLFTTPLLFYCIAYYDYVRSNGIMPTDEKILEFGLFGFGMGFFVCCIHIVSLKRCLNKKSDKELLLYVI